MTVDQPEQETRGSFQYGCPRGHWMAEPGDPEASQDAFFAPCIAVVTETETIIQPHLAHAAWDGLMVDWVPV